jgi:hypothetical protein
VLLSDFINRSINLSANRRFAADFHPNSQNLRFLSVNAVLRFKWQQFAGVWTSARDRNALYKHVWQAAILC